MQFIVIYGIRFIYGGRSRLPRDWEGVGLGGGIKPLARKGAHPRSGGFRLFLGLPHFPCQGLRASTKLTPPVSAHPTPAPSSRRALS